MTWFDDSLYTLGENEPLELEETQRRNSAIKYLMYEGWVGVSDSGKWNETWEAYMGATPAKIKERIVQGGHNALPEP